MINFVIKENGEKEPFDPQKLRSSIHKAAEEAGFSGEEKEEITRTVLEDVLNFLRGEEEIETEILRGRVVKKLEEVEPDIAEAWIDYEETK